MLKVYFELKTLALRLRQCDAQVLLKKKTNCITLCNCCKIINGLSTIKTTCEFYVDKNQTNLILQVFLLFGNEKKMGGETNLNITQWEQNVYQETVSILKNSPDKQAKITFGFYYFHCDQMECQKILLHCSELHEAQFQKMEKQNNMLIQQNQELKVQALNLKKINQNLQSSQEQLRKDYYISEAKYVAQLSQCQTNINKNHEEFLIQKQKKQEVLKIAKQIGIAQR